MNSCLLVPVVVLLFFSAVNGQGNGAVRLNVNGESLPTYTQGVVEVYYNSEWGTICDLDAYGSFGSIPSVVCQQLGYTGGYSGSTSSYLSTSPVIYDVSCSSEYLVILQCTYFSSPPSTCGSTDNVEVTCYSTRIWDSPYTGMVRLQNGYYSGQGMVQVYCNGQWGVVCNSASFDSYAATTVCTQLGYNDQSDYSSTSFTGTAWLDNVDCYYESCLSQCSGGSCPSSSVYCSSAANVTCSYNTGSSRYGSTRYTCGGGLTAGAIVGIVIGALVAFFICVVLIITIPICVCCCLGIGIGAAAGGTRRTTVAYSNMA
uniref:SRCR domain-containing protein n=1 Tax=Amphimedon queenslandica TaxID=400682 RepID=A0A1X7UDN2_AMPQE